MLSSKPARAGLVVIVASALLISACGISRIKITAPTPTGNAPTAAPAPSGPVETVGVDLDIELPEGDPIRGEQLFRGQMNGQYPCSACHSLTTGQTLVGPPLGDIAAVAATRREGYSAERYIHESIVQPNAHIPEGFTSPSVMPATFGEQMTKQDLADVMAFLTLAPARKRGVTRK